MLPKELKAQADVVNRLDLLVGKDGLTLTQVQSDLTNARNAAVIDNELVEHLEKVEAHKLALQATTDQTSDFNDAVTTSVVDLEDYLKEQLGLDILPSLDAALMEDEVANSVTAIKAITEIATAITQQFTDAESLANFDDALTGLVTAYKTSREAESAHMQEIDAYTETSAVVIALKAEVDNSKDSVEAALLSEHNIDVDDFLADGGDLRDYLGEDIGGVSSKINDLADPIKAKLSAVIAAINAMEDTSFFASEVSTLKTAVTEFFNSIDSLVDGASPEPESDLVVV